MRIDELEIGLKNINEYLVLVPCLLGTDIAIKQFKNANMIQGRIAWFDGKSDCNIKIYGRSYLNKKEEFLEVIDLLIEFMKTPISERGNHED